MLTDNELTRISDAVHALRPDWNPRSVRAYLAREHRNRAFADVVVAACTVAADPRSQTPARLGEHGPWWVAAQVASTDATPGPAHPMCGEHPDQPAGRCHPCTAASTDGPPADWRPVRKSPTSPERHFCQSLAMPPVDVATARCVCGATFIDGPAGRDSHAAVFGHAPITQSPWRETAEATS